MPPMLAEKATPSSTYIQVRRCSSSGSGASRPSASGSIIAAVAVLLIHIDRKAVSQNSQRTARPKLAPARRRPARHPAIQALALQAGGEREAAEEEEDHRVGELQQGLRKIEHLLAAASRAPAAR